MHIAPETIQQIQTTADILEVVNDFVSLKKRGSNWMACCPFHHEKTPSFSVSPSKGIYKCFGCGKGGDSISFVMDIENYSYLEALKYLAKKYNIEIKEERELTDEERAQQNEKESLLIIQEFAKEYYQNLLHNTKEGQTVGLSYYKERGFNLTTVQTFELGYSSPKWDGFTKAALQKSFRADMLEKAGLTIIKESNKQFDRFRDRMIFPIHNLSGKIIAFGGRILKKNPKAAKYLNSPETSIYHKSRSLYGIFQAKKSIREQDKCYLVEGYTDVLSLHQADIPNVVSSSGTSLTIDQIRIIARFTQNITVLYDGDNAGIKASIRGIDLILEEGLNVKIVVFPEGEDPDSYAKKMGPTNFKRYLIDNEQDFITFKTQLYLKEAKSDPIRRAEVIKEIVQSIIKIPDEVKQRIFFQECSSLLGIQEQTLVDEGNILRRKNNSQKFKKTTTPASLPIVKNEENQVTAPAKFTSPITPQEKEAIRLLLNYGTSSLKEGGIAGELLLQELEDVVFETPIYQRILNTFRKEFAKGNMLDLDYFTKGQDREMQQEAINLTTQQHDISNKWEERHFIYTPREETILDKVILENILRIKLHQIQKMIQENKKELEMAQTPEKQDNLMIVALKLENIRKEIAKNLNNVILKNSS